MKVFSNMLQRLKLLKRIISYLFNFEGVEMT